MNYLKNYLLIILLIVSISSCSSLKKSQTYGTLGGSLICGTLGVFLGAELSPNPESDSFNKLIGATSGAVACGVAGHYLAKSFYNEDPRNFEMKPINIEKKVKKNTPVLRELNNDSANISLEDLSLSNKTVVNIPQIKSLPDSLKSKIARQKIIKYKILPQVFKTRDGRSIYFSGGEAIEQVYESQ